MPNLDLNIACWDYDRTRPLTDGRVQPEGINLDITVLRPREIFPRMLQDQEFHASEMSLASYVILKARDQCPFVAIPVMLSKIFRHDCIYVRPDAGINEPADLRGKRIGLPQYSSTAGVFIKGLMQHEYGVSPQQMTWFMGGQDTPAPAPLVPLDLPDDIHLEFIPEDKTLEGMLADGELDALFATYIPNLFLSGSPTIARLFPNFKEVEQDYYRRTGIFPIMHTVVIREDVHREHPWVAASLYEAFSQAKDLAVGGLYDTDALALTLPFLIDHLEESRRIFGSDYWSYGVESNRPALEGLSQYVVDQGLAPRVVSTEELFPAITP
ncbi:MAG TPA: ABC transporter substrate-binding protein [Dehalococcoidia bacterium]|jgi:4,5-dihydroxyphthalate decarboxylase|nr:ABC transporter substrate-binding protein [Dehalococcoidia bacterium]MEE2928775.1 PhnD/SsuA/transferrin family substrate-binding protein [Chloroflexota bacterium]HIB12988.1 ABC transporter substrate-binding protein [Dehalococcoidia bacterium]HIM47313.1 ABC transporter substrate-binding protein [Dehalococcoidia bacterium]